MPFPEPHRQTFMDAASRVRFRSGQDFSSITSLRHLIDVTAISSGAGWNGLHLEIGRAKGWHGEDLVVDGHFVSMNIMKSTRHFEMRAEDEQNWTAGSRAPGAFWIHPEGRPLSHRVRGPTRWAGAIIDGKFLDAVMGQPYELRPGLNVEDKLLQTLFQALIDALLDPVPPTSAVKESLVKSFVLALATRHGYPVQEIQANSKLRDTDLKSLLAWIGNHLDSKITVSAMAAQVGLSVAHFSREFKLAVGMTPWEYVIETRLARARRLLENGESVGFTALECGFFDQAHLARLFKQKFGLAPSVFARQR